MSADEYVSQTREAAEYIRSKLPDGFQPIVAIAIGSGLDKFAELVEAVATIPYKDIPHHPQTTVAGHEGVIIAGNLAGVPIIGLKGRIHYYEVADQQRPIDRVVFPVHVVANLGCKLYLATNAAGGLNPSFSIGELMVVTSHIGFFMPNPFLGWHHDFGNNSYFQPTDKLYSPKLRTTFLSLDKSVLEGVYAAVTGRSYETQAECLTLREFGADAVGMSTVPEILVAHNRGLDTFACSVITNIIAEDGTNATNHDEVVAILTDEKTKSRLMSLFQGFFEKIKGMYT